MSKINAPVKKLISADYNNMQLCLKILLTFLSFLIQQYNTIIIIEVIITISNNRRIIPANTNIRYGVLPVINKTIKIFINLIIFNKPVLIYRNHDNRINNTMNNIIKSRVIIHIMWILSLHIKSLYPFATLVLAVVVDTHSDGNEGAGGSSSVMIIRFGLTRPQRSTTLIVTLWGAQSQRGYVVIEEVWKPSVSLIDTTKLGKSSSEKPSGKSHWRLTVHPPVASLLRCDLTDSIPSGCLISTNLTWLQIM